MNMIIGIQQTKAKQLYPATSLLLTESEALLKMKQKSYRFRIFPYYLLHHINKLHFSLNVNVLFDKKVMQISKI